MKQATQLFPYALARIASEPLEEFGKLNLKQTIIILHSVEKIQQDLDNKKEVLSNELHTVIATVKDKKKRNDLIQLRRNMYNERITLPPINYEKELPKTLTKRINQYVALLERKQELLKKDEWYFEKESKQRKKILIKLLKKDAFQKGLLLSSSTLPDSLNKYLAEQKKPLPKVERSLMKYLSRMYTKPSPFSTFTSVAPVSFSKTSNLFSKEQPHTQSHIQLNHYLYYYFYSLLVQNKEVRKQLKIRINPTVQLSENQFIFLANNFNRESIQRINKNQALDIIHEIIEKKRNWVYQEFIGHLLKKHFTEITQKEMEDYIDKLLLYGFIEYDLGISTIDVHWHKKISKLLTPLKRQFPYLSNIQNTLALLEHSLSRYEKASTKKRTKILSDAFAQIKELNLRLSTTAKLPKTSIKKQKRLTKDELFKYTYITTFKIRPHELWYEDVAVDQQLQLSENVKEKLTILNYLLNRMGWFDKCHMEHYSISDFFRKNYQETEKVDLLTFYESFYRMKQAKKKRKNETNSLDQTIQKRSTALLSHFDKQISKRLRNNDVIMLYKSDIEQIPHNNEHASYSAFFHLIINSDNRPSIIVNSIVPGFGKMFSRFLTFFPDEITNAIREYNKKTNSNAFLAEQTDSSTFNANIHPNLMPYEITLPGNYSNLPPNRTISISDIEVCFKKADNLIHLFHKKNGKEIFVFDLGFQGSEGRSGMYNFLSQFTIGTHHHLNALTQHINAKCKKNNQGVTILPRITYESCVVLQRKKWEIAKDVLPIRLPQENDWEYFKKIESFRKKLFLPYEIFVTLPSEKPQYIHFANPFLVSIFEKIIEKTKEKDILHIEEMLPTTEDLFPINGGKHVTEFLTQWYC